jgi:predicted nucleotidyltransferase
MPEEDEGPEWPEDDALTVPGTEGREDLLVPYGTLFRRSAMRLLLALGRQYTRKYHVRDLSRTLHYDVSMISKNLKHLEAMGLVIREEVGNLVFYQANMNSALLRHMKVCFTLLEINDLVRSVEPVSSNIVLYGSCATGEDTTESDVDLFIETFDKGAVGEILKVHREAARRPLSPIIVTPNETYVMKTRDSTLFASIQQGIILKGGEHVS